MSKLNRLSPNWMKFLPFQVTEHSKSKPSRPDHFYELRSAYFKLLTSEELNDEERKLICMDLSKNYSGEEMLHWIIGDSLTTCDYEPADEHSYDPDRNNIDPD